MDGEGDGIVDGGEQPAEEPQELQGSQEHIPVATAVKLENPENNNWEDDSDVEYVPTIDPVITVDDSTEDTEDLYNIVQKDADPNQTANATYPLGKVKIQPDHDVRNNFNGSEIGFRNKFNYFQMNLFFAFRRKEMKLPHKGL